MARKTRAEREREESRASERFDSALARIVTASQAVDFVCGGPPNGKPGGHLYTKLASFLRQGYNTCAEFEDLARRLAEHGQPAPGDPIYSAAIDSPTIRRALAAGVSTK